MLRGAHCASNTERCINLRVLEGALVLEKCCILRKRWVFLTSCQRTLSRARRRRRAGGAVLCARHLQVLHDALLVMPLLVMPSAFPCAA